MKLYIKFLIKEFTKSFTFVFLIILSLVLILNVLNEIEFFKDKNVHTVLPLFLSLLNSPYLIFEIFPFIFLISTQVFFIYFFQDNQIQIFKYSGLKNIKILTLLCMVTFALGLIIIVFFYNISSNLKAHYLNIKSKYETNAQHLAVVTKNGLWIKDIIDNKFYIINATEIKNDFIYDVFISEFNQNYDLIKNYKSNKVNIKNKEWKIYEPVIFENNDRKELNELTLKSNFDSNIISNLFSNLSSQSILKLFELRNNSKSLKYSTTDVDLQINKILSYPIYITLITMLASIIMFNTKIYKSNTFKITLGLFISVVIYYINNLFHVMGGDEKIPLIISVWGPLSLLFLINSTMLIKINEK